MCPWRFGDLFIPMQFLFLSSLPNLESTKLTYFMLTNCYGTNILSELGLAKCVNYEVVERC